MHNKIPNRTFLVRSLREWDAENDDRIGCNDRPAIFQDCRSDGPVLRSIELPNVSKSDKTNSQRPSIRCFTTIIEVAKHSQELYGLSKIYAPQGE